jgi:hypothetical protein
VPERQGKLQRERAKRQPARKPPPAKAPRHQLFQPSRTIYG